MQILTSPGAKAAKFKRTWRPGSARCYNIEVNGDPFRIRTKEGINRVKGAGSAGIGPPN